MSRRSKKPTLLVPVDFSRTSERGIERAGRFARTLGARIVLVFVTPDCKQYDRFTGGSDLYGDGTLVDLNARLRRLAADHAGEDVEAWSVVLLSDDPADTIRRYAVEIGADMIIMGTHARQGLDHLLRPSTAEAVVRRATCPVVTVGPRGPRPGPQSSP